MPRASCECGKFYVIKEGEALGKIAEKFAISREALLQMNPYLNPGYYRPGQMIVVPEELPEEYFIYTARPGEHLADLIRRFQLSIAELRILNPELDVFNIRSGERICIKKSRGEYEILPGENLYALARKFQLEPIDLLRSNAHLRPNEFVEGQRIRVKR